MENIKEVEVSTKEINLTQFLKWANIISSGGEITFLMAAEKIKLNGNTENRKRVKLKNNDIIEIDKLKLKVIYKTIED